MINLYCNADIFMTSKVDLSNMNGSLFMLPIDPYDSLSVRFISFPVNSSIRVRLDRSVTNCAVYGSYTYAQSYLFGIYSYNGSTLSLHTSVSTNLSTTITLSGASTTHTSGSISNNPVLYLGWAGVEFIPFSLSQGNWWIGYAFSSSSSQSALFSNLTAFTTTTATLTSTTHVVQQYHLNCWTNNYTDGFVGPFYKGYYSTTTSALPSTVHSSDMVQGQLAAGHLVMILGS